MALFQESVLKQQLSNLNDELLVPSWKQFKYYFKSTTTQEKILELKEEEFELIFGFSMESFYASLSNYSTEIQSVLPSETITLEEIFEDL